MTHPPSPPRPQAWPPSWSSCSRRPTRRCRAGCRPWRSALVRTNPSVPPVYPLNSFLCTEVTGIATRIEGHGAAAAGHVAAFFWVMRRPCPPLSPLPSMSCLVLASDLAAGEPQRTELQADLSGAAWQPARAMQLQAPQHPFSSCHPKDFPHPSPIHPPAHADITPCAPPLPPAVPYGSKSSGRRGGSRFGGRDFRQDRGGGGCE